MAFLSDIEPATIFDHYREHASGRARASDPHFTDFRLRVRSGNVLGWKRWVVVLVGKLASSVFRRDTARIKEEA